MADPKKPKPGQPRKPANQPKRKRPRKKQQKRYDTVVPPLANDRPATAAEKNAAIARALRELAEQLEKSEEEEQG